MSDSASSVQSSLQDAHGRCLCGKVKVKADQVALTAGACHCQYCRKWGEVRF